jgi:hypothetical protein
MRRRDASLSVGIAQEYKSAPANAMARPPKATVIVMWAVLPDLCIG